MVVDYKIFHANQARCLQASTERGLSFGLAVALTLSTLLIPTRLQYQEIHYGRAQVDPAEVSRLLETVNVYSILKSQGTNLNDRSIWSIAVTVLEESKKYSLDPALVLGVMWVESHFQHNAVSAAGARGLMQIHPSSASALAEEAGLKTWGPKMLNDPIFNIKLGVFYLGYLKQKFKDLKLALSAYCWGPTEIQNRLEKQQAVPLDFAKRVLTVSQAYRQTQNVWIKRETIGSTPLIEPGGLNPVVVWNGRLATF